MTSCNLGIEYDFLDLVEVGESHVVDRRKIP